MTTNIPSRYAQLSILAAIVTIALKMGAYLLTDSVGLLSDALESVVNLVAAIAVFFAIIVAARPPDDEHSFGHYKVEYFSSGVEGALIVMTAILIVISAVQRIQGAQPLESLGLGIGITGLATILNFGVAQILRRAAKRHRSIALEADAQHLMSDVWTSLGVIVGLGVMQLTGWQWVDIVIALAVAVHILLVGWRLLRKSLLGLMDSAWPQAEQQQLIEILERFGEGELTFHALRTRLSGSLRFVSLHLQVPGSWSVQHGHRLMDDLEAQIRAQLSPVSIIIHLEPLEDPASWADVELFRPNHKHPQREPSDP